MMTMPIDRNPAHPTMPRRRALALLAAGPLALAAAAEVCPKWEPGAPERAPALRPLSGEAEATNRNGDPTMAVATPTRATTPDADRLLASAFPDRVSDAPAPTHSPALVDRALDAILRGWQATLDDVKAGMPDDELQARVAARSAALRAELVRAHGGRGQAAWDQAMGRLVTPAGLLESYLGGGSHA